MKSTYYANLDRQIMVLNYSNYFPNNVYDLINSSGFEAATAMFLNSKKCSSNTLPCERLTADKYVPFLKKILANDDTVFDEYSKIDWLASVESFYTFYRSMLRISVLEFHEGDEIIQRHFKEIDHVFNEVVRALYRSIGEKLQGHENRIIRQMASGTNAAILVKEINWKVPSKYECLSEVKFINRLMLRPPVMLHTKSNKRRGLFTEAQNNPISRFPEDADQWYCYPAKIGESLAFIYFHADYFVSGLALANLFELAETADIENKRPDIVLLFGLHKTEKEKCNYFYDKENDIWVGEVPYSDQTTYFGYMKKMCLTLHNLRQIQHGKLPIHGSMVRIKFADGREKNVVFFGDSGAGKSESLEALKNVADDKIVSLETIFDDMGSFAIDDENQVYAQGTEVGAFVRLDDLSSEVTFNNMDRGIYLNAEKSNARVIIPTDEYSRVVKHHPIDMWVYANNYTDKVGVHRFDDLEEAKKTFISGKRIALGTTDEVGMTTTFFANPFGPVQKEEETRSIIDKVFDNLFKNGVYVGEIYTHLGTDKSKQAIEKSASELLDVLLSDND